MRFNTLENKIFRFVTVKTPNTLVGTVAASVIDPGGADTSTLTVSSGARVRWLRTGSRPP
ncbi:hypothetical protein [Streptomyces sp. NBC_01361]|uniref:hypothetical protein n=1 Tax=Streptomyces sp. NBC_01361 TaxID=2903838 RepID=UPI002E305E6C|nr:hypothetical protein [Streptomyces sp. NBC_01361]